MSGSDDPGVGRRHRDAEVVAAPLDPDAPRLRTDPSKLLGVPGATALIIGGVVGTGVFTLPASLAPYGMIAIVALLLVTVGAICVGLVFARMSRTIARAGGPYAYPHEVLGNLAGFVAAWSYWLTTAVGNAGIVVSWTFYVNALFGWTTESLVRDFSIAMVGLWIPVAINFIGLQQVRIFQLVTVALKVVPLVFMASIGLFWAAQRWEFPALNPSGMPGWLALGSAGALVLFIYLGVEDASSAAGRVRNPRQAVARATIIGTFIVAILYVGSTVAIFGIVPTEQLASSPAPFSTALDLVTGSSAAGQLMAFFAVVSGIGALNGLTLLVAEVPRAAAADGLLPSFFTRITRRDAPYVGLIASATLASLLVVVASIGTSGIEVFNVLVLMTGITSALPYCLTCVAALVVLVRWRHPPPSRAMFVRDCTITVLALLFSIACIAGSGWLPLLGVGLLMAVGFVVYGWDQRRRRVAAEAPPDPSLSV